MLTWLKFQLERWVLRGSLALVLLLVGVLASLALTGATLGYFLPSSPFDSYRDALWWAILRLSDPGYLADDPARWPVRMLSISLSVLGMGVTVGGIVAIVTQVLTASLRRLAQATTKVPFRDHIVLLGWSDRTPRLLRALISVRRRGKIAILLEEVDQAAMKRLARVLPKVRMLERVVLRSGSVYRPWELDRAAVRAAKAILIPATTAAVAGDPHEGPRTLQTLVALRNLFTAYDEDEDNPEPWPTVAVELVDRSMAPVVESTLPGVRVLQSDRVVARVLRFCLQGPNLVDFALDVAAPNRGYRVESARLPELAGCSLFEVERRLHRGRLLGRIAGSGRHKRLDVNGDSRIQATDRLLVFSKGGVEVVDPRPVDEAWDQLATVELAPPKRRLLILGWNEAAPDLLAELSQEGPDRYEMDVLSVVEPDLRLKMTRSLVREARVPVRHHHGNPADPYTLGGLALGTYDRILILADRVSDPESADVSSLSIALSIEQRQSELKPGCYVLSELLEDENAKVLRSLQAVVTPRLAADTLETIALSPDGDETLAVTFAHQATYTTRILDVPAQWLHRLDDVARATRARGLALVHAFGKDGSTPARLVIAEPVKERHGQQGDREKRGAGRRQPDERAPT